MGKICICLCNETEIRKNKLQYMWFYYLELSHNYDEKIMQIFVSFTKNSFQKRKERRVKYARAQITEVIVSNNWIFIIIHFSRYECLSTRLLVLYPLTDWNILQRILSFFLPRHTFYKKDTSQSHNKKFSMYYTLIDIHRNSFLRFFFFFQIQISYNGWLVDDVYKISNFVFNLGDSDWSGIG